jgi:hypothetical protein
MNLIVSMYTTVFKLYKMLSNIHLLRLSLYVDKIIGDRQCGFRCNRSITVQDMLHQSDTREKTEI